MPVTLQIQDYVATVTLDRPEALNSLDPESITQLKDIWAEITRNPEIRVAVLTAAGEKAFCTGADLKKTMPPKESFAQLHYAPAGAETFAAVLSKLYTEKPVICAINGYALGGGLELALLCDVRIASTKAIFSLPEVCIGSIPGAGGTQRLIRTVGRSDAMLMLLTGERIDAAEALRIGLVSRVVEPDQLLPTAQALAEKIAGNAPLAVAAVKRLASIGGELPLAAGLELEQHAFGVLRDSEDRIEGRKAFAEKRKPNFRGC
jgi:E-phenylitaconyl-CoA hydratase